MLFFRGTILKCQSFEINAGLPKLVRYVKVVFWVKLKCVHKLMYAIKLLSMSFNVLYIDRLVTVLLNWFIWLLELDKGWSKFQRFITLQSNSQSQRKTKKQLMTSHFYHQFQSANFVTSKYFIWLRILSKQNFESNFYTTSCRWEVNWIKQITQQSYIFKKWVPCVFL